MKFNWGTGIFTFIIIFLLLCAAFIAFTVKQGVNLVYEDYYEKGVDHTAQMKVKDRSIEFKDDLEIIYLDKYLVIDITEKLSSKIDSGRITMFRPSDNKMDVRMLLEQNSSKITIPKSDLITGRYILKFHWYNNGKKYELNRPVNVQ